MADLAMWSMGKKVSLKGIKDMQDEFMVSLSERSQEDKVFDCESAGSRSEDEGNQVDFEGSSSEASEVTSFQVEKLEKRPPKPWRGQTLLRGEVQSR